MANRYRYKRGELHGDLALGIGGLVAGGIFTMAAWQTTFLLALFLAVTALALYFTYNTVRRYWIEVRTDEQSISLFSRDRKPVIMAWSDVQSMKLKFFGSRSQREKGKGTLTLTLVDRQNKKLSVESGLENFEDLAVFSYDQTRSYAIEIDPVSADNFKAVGVQVL